MIDQATRDTLATGYEGLTLLLTLPDPDDRHILAAAIIGRCDVIVTRNLHHFPNTALAPYSVEAQHPDEFLRDHLSLAPGPFCSAIRKVRTRLKKPAYDVDDYLAILTRQGLVATAAGLRPFANLL